MTPEEALEIITNAIQTDKKTVEQDKALAIAQKALEKQIPKKPGATEDYPHRLYCPNCYYPFERNKSEIALIREHFIVGNKYCPDCGQALDWSDTND